MNWPLVWDSCVSPDFERFHGYDVSRKRYSVRMLGHASWMFWPKTNIKVVREVRGINQWFWKWGDYAIRDGDAGNITVAYKGDLINKSRWCVVLDYNMEDNSKLVRRIRDFIVMIPADIEDKVPGFVWKKYSKCYDYPKNHVLYLGDFHYMFRRGEGSGHKHFAWFLLELIPEDV